MEVFFVVSDFDVEIDKFMLDCSAKGLAIKTMKSYEQTLFAKWLDVEFNITTPQEVTGEHLRTYMKGLAERGKYEMSTANDAVNYPERRRDYGKKLSNTTIAISRLDHS